MTELKSRFRQLTSSFCVSFVESGERADKCIAITEEIAIGFSIWTEKNGWDWSGNHQVFINDDFEPKEASELFKDYMESLKP